MGLDNNILQGIDIRGANPSVSEESGVELKFRSIGEQLGPIINGSPESMVNFQNHLLNSMGGTDLSVTDPTEKKTTAIEYVKDAKTYLEPSLTEVQMGEVRQFMKDTGNNLGLLFSSLLFEEEKDRAGFISLMAGTLSKKAMKEGIPLNISTRNVQELVDAAKTFGQNYPTFEGKDGKASLIACLEDALMKYNEMQTSEAEETHELSPGRGALLQSVIENRPEFENDTDSFGTGLMMQRFIVSGNNPYYNDRSGFFENVGELRKVLWGILDPESGMLKEKMGTDSVLFLDGAIDFIRPRIHELTGSDLDLLMLAITDPQKGIGSKDAGKYLGHKKLLGFTAELVQRNPSYQKLFQESFAPEVASQVIDEFETSGGVIDKDFYDRWENAAIIMTLGLNGASEKYYDTYFSFASHFNGMRFDPFKLDATQYIPGKYTLFGDDQYRDSQGFLEGYRPTYGKEGKEYDYRYKFPIVAEEPIKGLSTYIDLSLAYARRESDRVGGSLSNYMEELSNLVVSRSNHMNLDEHVVYKIIKDFTEVFESSIEGRISGKTPNLSRYYQDFFNHCLNLISDDENQLREIKYPKNDKFELDVKTLRNILDTYERKRTKKEDLSRRMATGVNEGDVIDAHLKKLTEDEDNEYLPWMEERRLEFQRLLGVALRSDKNAEANTDGPTYEQYSNRDNYLNIAYIKARYRELRENQMQVAVEDSTVFSRLYDDDENFSVDNLWDLFKPENQVISEEDYAKLFSRDRGYAGTINIMLYTSSITSTESNRIINENIPAIRDFLSNKLLNLPPEHPFSKLIGSCQTSVPNLIQQLEAYETNVRNHDEPKHKDLPYDDLRKVINFLGHIIITKAVMESEDRVLERTENELGVVEGTSTKLEGTIGRYSDTHYYGTAQNKAEITPVNLAMRAGQILILTGPTGSGKSVALDAILTTTRTAMEQGYTTAKTTRIPESITRPDEIGDFEMQEVAGHSLFQSSAKHEVEEILLRLLYGADEPFVGSPEPYKVALITAILALESARLNYSAIASHQASPIIEVLKVLGFNDQLLPMMVDPTTHMISEGVSGSYGIDMIDMQGGSQPFVELMQALQYAREQGFSEIEISEILEQLTEPEDIEGEIGVDELTIESSNLLVCVRTILDSVVRNDSSGIMLDRAMEYFSNSNDSIESDVEYFENMETADVERYNTALNHAIEFDSLIGGTRRGVKFLVGSTTRNYDQRSMVKLSELSQSAEIIEQLKSRNQLALNEEEVKELNYLFGDGFYEAGKEAETGLNVLGDLQPTDEMVFKISQLIKEDGKLMVSFRSLLESNLGDEAIRENAEIFSEENIPEMTRLFFKTYLENPKKFSWSKGGNTDLERYRMYQILMGDYAKSIADNLESKESPVGKSFDEFQRRFKGINAERLLGLCVSQYEYGTKDEKIIKFIKPEERISDDHRVTPMAFREGVNLSLISQVGSKYVPQSYYYEGDTPMTPSEDTQIEFLTGLQGGGKTEMLRLMMQQMIYLKYFNRVPAEGATVFWRPKNVVGVIKRPTTGEKTSSFMGEAKRIVATVNRIGEDTALFYDEPANGTSVLDRNDIIAAIVAIAKHRGANFRLTNHETGVYTALDRIEGMRYSTLGYTTEEAEDYGFRYNFIAGAETFQVAEKMELPKEVVDLARFIYETREQLQQHKERVIYKD